MSSRFDFLEIDPNARLPRGRPAAGAPPAPEAEPVAAPPERLWRVAEVIGGPGAGVGEFASPGGLAVDHHGYLYVADSYNHRVQRISPQGDVSAIGQRGKRLGEFLNPQAVAVAPVRAGLTGGRLFVLEQGNHRIQVFDLDGTPVEAWGGRGDALDQLSAPMGLAVDPAGGLYVSDTGNNRVVRWSEAGRPVAVLDAETAGGPLFGKPLGLCVDRAGRLFVVDALRHQVLVFDAALRLVTRLGAPGDGPGQLVEPEDVDVDAAGHLLVAEAGSHRLQILDREGRPLQQIDEAPKLGRFQAPSSVAVGPDRSAYVADTGNHRIFRLSKQPAGARNRSHWPA